MTAMLVLALAPARATEFAPGTTSMLFAPGSAEITPEARDALLGFLRPPRPPAFRGHCLTGHADRGPAAEALARARAEAVAAMMARQGVDPADIAVAAMGDRMPARLAPPGRAEPMNDRLELTPCPGPRLAGVAEAEALALDAAVVPPFVAAIAPMVARAVGCAEPAVPRGALATPPFACPAEVPPDAVPVLVVLRVAGTRRVMVALDWPAGFGSDQAQRRGLAAAGAVLDLFGLPVALPLAVLAAEPGAARRAEVSARGFRAEVEAGPGAARRLRLVPIGGDGP
ncbi:OmpA family protein [Roseomonas sp. PWR1]|uniref:OmpA family protein n=1 Tax=Roseomonas nitratireducens TaxID=2820810 RepID=A0ABS4AU29_9PROT|nr:OmpA family protein [Neoroseomonas nitratireducens]MBP0464865.1 OmpA family protein [Neoroseomonas nitratireducens]